MDDREPVVAVTNADDRHDCAQARIDELELVLEWYADPEHYRARWTRYGNYLSAEVEEDNGRRARDVLHGRKRGA